VQESQVWRAYAVWRHFVLDRDKKVVSYTTVSNFYAVEYLEFKPWQKE
jgi:hypothetical protein